MKRYQNPDVYERLALEYSLGTMHGRARKRFEKLMQQHSFLSAVVATYDDKFAELITALPEKKRAIPSTHVWKNIEAQLDAEAMPQTEKYVAIDGVTTIGVTYWWQIFTTKSFVSAATSLALLVTIIFVSVLQNTPNYSCKLAAENAKVMFNVSISKAEMQLRLSRVGKGVISIPEGKQMHFWCVPKNPNEPIMSMGVVPTSGTQMPLTAKSWQGIEAAAMFGISFESEGSQVTEPTGAMIYKGSIEAEAVSVPQSNAKHYKFDVSSSLADSG